jgi:hypothetical protein
MELLEKQFCEQPTHELAEKLPGTIFDGILPGNIRLKEGIVKSGLHE